MQRSWRISPGSCVLSCLAWMPPRSARSPPGRCRRGRRGSTGRWLLAIGTPGGLRAVLAAVRGWTLRTGRTVEVSIGGDALKMTGVSSQQQEQITDAWLAHHAPGG